MPKTGIHIKPCNTGSAEQHNRRDKDYLERLDASDKKTYDIFRDETHLNRSWVNPAYQGRTLPEILEDIRKEVKEKTGRALQEGEVEYTDKNGKKKKRQGCSPIREGVCPILPSTQLSDFAPVVEWYKAHGAAVIRIDLHHDEGHTDAVSGERKHNHHAHIIVDYIDHSTGRSVKLSKEDISELQGVVASALHMERGTSKAETGAEHLAAQEYREKKAGENAARLEARCRELEQQMAQDQQEHTGELRAVCKNLQGLANVTVQHFDRVCSYEAADPTDKEREARDRLDQERQRDLLEMQNRELLQHQLDLRNLMLRVQRAVDRIGKRLQKLADSVPFWKKGRLAHEADLQAAVASANAERDQARAEAQKAVKSAENAQSAAESAKSSADNLARQHREALRTIEADKAAAREEGRKAGATAKDKEWRQWYNDTGKPAIEELDQLRDEKAKWDKERKGWLQDFKNIARTLNTRYDADTVKDFEKAGLRDMVGHDLWDDAKEPEQKQSKGYTPHL